MSETHPVIRINFLLEPEILEFLEVWREKSIDKFFSNAKVVISSDPKGIYPQKFVAPEDKPITYYRNNNLYGLIYIETELTSDAQSLKNAFTVRDSDLLNGVVDQSEEQSALSLIINNSWNIISCSKEETPQFLQKQISEVFKKLRGSNRLVSLRSFLKFCVRICIERSVSDKNYTLTETNRIIGLALQELDLFQDEYWAESDSDSKIKRRLFINSEYASLYLLNGQEIDTGEVIERLDSIVFKSYEGEILESGDQIAFRHVCKQFCQSTSRADREQVPFFIFEQLFQKDTRGLGLGEKVKVELEGFAPERVEEYLSLGVIEGLNSKDSSEAERFLNSVPKTGSDYLKNIILTATKKQIERLASPTAKSIDNPISALVKVVEEFSKSLEKIDKDAFYIVKLSPVLRNGDAETTLRLFNFLYSRLLNEICDTCEDSLEGFAFSIDDRLNVIVPPPSINCDDTEEEQGPEELEWPPLLLKFELNMILETGKLNLIDYDQSFQWNPKNIKHLAFFWILISSKELKLFQGKLKLPPDVDFSTFIEHVVKGSLPITSLATNPFDETAFSSSPVNEAFNVFDSFQDELHDHGLNRESMNSFIDNWKEISEEIRSKHIPTGSPEKLVSDFLSLAIIYNSSGRAAIMLPIHPIKLRWLSHYFESLVKYAEQSLSLRLELNAQNPDFFISRIFSTTSFQQPAIIFGQAEGMLFSKREIGWFEYYSIKDNFKSVDEDVDQSVIDDILPQIHQYIRAYPHKVDGLSLLIVLSRGAALPYNLIIQLKRGEWKDLVVEVHVLAPKETWRNVSELFEKLPMEDRLSGSGLLHPSLQLHFYDLNDLTSVKEGLQAFEFDIGIISQFFSEALTVEEETKSPFSEANDSYNPLLDRPTRLEVSGTGEKVTISQVPYQHDQVSETWSTIVVRQKRGRPIAPDNVENSDIVKLTSNFTREVDLFNLMHRICHWVVTVEKNISREYIESLENKPAILSVQENVACGGLYTMIISSNSGAGYVIQRLARKIANIHKFDDQLSRTLADKVYLEAKNLAPSLALQAMGISRITEEMLGLVVAKNLANIRMPISVVNGFSAWISLDNHTDWFGGVEQYRADLCRLDVELTKKDGLEVNVIIVEAKFRRFATNDGRRQIERTIRLFSEFLAPAHDKTNEKIDAFLWRSILIDAVENCSMEAKKFYGSFCNIDAVTNQRVPPEIKEKFRAGEYKFNLISGLYSQSIYGQQGNVEHELIEVDSYHYESISTFSNHMRSLVLDDHSDLEGEFFKSRKHTSTIQSYSNSENVKDKVDIGQEGATQIGEMDIGVGKISKEVLVRRYQKIIDTLAEFRVVVEPVGEEREKFLEGPATVVYRIKLGLGVTPTAIFNKSDSLKLALELEEDQRLRISIDRGNILIEVPKVQEERYFVTVDSLWARWSRPTNELSCPVGIDQKGNVVVLNFSSSNSPHLLIGGTTGSGKSEALNTILSGLQKHYSPNELGLSLVDPKTTELIHYENSPHLVGNILSFDDEAIEMLDVVVEEMDGRYALLKSKRVKSLSAYNEIVSEEEKLPWKLIVLDEYGDLTTDPEAKKEIEKRLKRLAQKARSAGIHVIIATQKPSAEVISTNLRSNLNAQLALRVKSAIESNVIMDSKGAETLNGKGDAFLKAEGKLIRIQCAYVPD